MEHGSARIHPGKCCFATPQGFNRVNTDFGEMVCPLKKTFSTNTVLVPAELKKSVVKLCALIGDGF